MRLSVISMVVLAVASMAVAAPSVGQVAAVEVVPGVWAADVFVTDGAAIGSWAMNLTFTAAGANSINEASAFGAVPITKQDDADLYGAMPAANYNKATDTYAYNPFAKNVLPEGIVASANSFKMHVASGPGTFGQSNILHLAGAGIVNYTGTVSRGGTDYAVSGQILLPEPATMSLLGLGLLGLVRRRRA